MILAQNKNTYQSANRLQETYGVSVETLRRWDASGRIAIVRTTGRKRLYSISELRGIFGDNQTQPAQKAKICYSRVKRQIANLRQHYPECEIGSGSQLEMQRFCCPSGINTQKKNRRNGGCLKGLSLILFICFNFYCLYHFTNFFY